MLFCKILRPHVQYDDKANFGEPLFPHRIKKQSEIVEINVDHRKGNTGEVILIPTKTLSFLPPNRVSLNPLIQSDLFPKRYMIRDTY